MTEWPRRRAVTLSRRDAMQLLAAGAALAAAFPPDAGAAQTRSRPMITCIIRYEIDPFHRDAFAEYARNWGGIIPECGGHLVGYFLPYEGTNDIACGLIAFDSLAAYETYRTRLRSHPKAQQNFALARNGRFVRREERTFVEIVDGTFERRPV